MIVKTALALSVLVGAAWVPHAVAADVGRGKLDFGMCYGCHGLGPRAGVKVGPPLNGIVGRPWASYPGYSYSQGLRAGHAAGKTWTAANLNEWLKDPGRMVPGTKMRFAGLPNPVDRADVIAYLEQFNASGHKK